MNKIILTMLQKIKSSRFYKFELILSLCLISPLFIFFLLFILAEQRNLGFRSVGYTVFGYMFSMLTLGSLALFIFFFYDLWKTKQCMRAAKPKKDMSWFFSTIYISFPTFILINLIYSVEGLFMYIMVQNASSKSPSYLFPILTLIISATGLCLNASLLIRLVLLSSNVFVFCVHLSFFVQALGISKLSQDYTVVPFYLFSVPLLIRGIFIHSILTLLLVNKIERRP